MLEFQLLKTIFLYMIFSISVIYQVILFISMIKNRRKIDFLSVIKREGSISKAGIFFFVLMAVIVYQALFLDQITPGLVELMGLIIAGDVGARYVSDKKHIELEKIKKTNYNMSSDEFKDL